MNQIEKDVWIGIEKQIKDIKEQKFKYFKVYQLGKQDKQKEIKDTLREKIHELSIMKDEEFGKSMAGRYRWQGFLECSNGILELLLSKEEKDG